MDVQAERARINGRIMALRERIALGIDIAGSRSEITQLEHELATLRGRDQGIETRVGLPI